MSQAGARARSRRTGRATADAGGGARLFQVPKEAPTARPRKLAEVIAYAIKRDIAARGWPVGEVLGNQEELMQRYGVSRSTLREAIRQVERHGIAHMRRGAHGGLVVQSPARDSVVLAVASYLELAGVSLGELFDAREVVEGLMVGLICERATDNELMRLRDRLDDLLSSPEDDLEQDVVLELKLRSAIAELSRNGALQLLLEALYRVTSDMLTVAPGHPDTRALVRESRREKRELVEALVAGDEISARVAVRDALERSRQQARKLLKTRRADFGQASALTLGAKSMAVDPTGVLPKLGHRLSLRIANDVVEAGLEAGDRVGSEPELCERYDVSRAVFREAVRTLEVHDIVQVRRGLGGGLTVGRPDPAYTVELTSLYFQYARLKPRHFYELWRAIQVAAAQFAARRMNESGRAELTAVVERQKAAGSDEMLTVHGELHSALSRLSGNHVIELFTSVMAEIAAHYPTEVPPAGIWQAFVKSHAELVEAVSDGGVALARRLMLRHLQLVDAWYGESSRREWLTALAEADDPSAAVHPPDSPARRRGGRASSGQPT